MKSPKGLDVELPVVEVMKDAIWSLMAKRQILLSRFLPVMLVLALIDWGSSVFLEQGSTLQFLPMILSLMVSIVFATSVHRFTLTPNAAMMQPGVWRRAETLYLRRGFMIGFIFAGIVSLVMLIVAMILGKQMVAAAAVAGLMVALYVTARVSVGLPEIAMGRESSLRRAWELSDGNGSRLVLVVWILPVLLSSPFLAMYFTDHIVLRLFASFGTYLMTLFSLVTLSLAYRFLADFVDGDEASGSVASTVVNSEHKNADGFDA
ncbi:hypothetical protein [Parathalassolituus penaei]|uniref:Uncharacterized protein n=1 Tax=Parathalassolituus penaei TaxID=2997323 RepID=A0A9X3EF62_9GAMM|nr:hypothetical protein [Parathalassolituus penaei]MCY0966404.1 hypothetical protein [Parathalassolituus penaei]